MADAMEKLALCNANLSNVYVKLQKKYETIREQLDCTRKVLANTTDELIKTKQELRE